MGAEFPRRRVALRQAAGGTAVMEAECGFGLAIVPVPEIAIRLGSTASAPDGTQGPGDRQVRGTGFTFYHAASGVRLLPQGWFFTTLEAAREGLAAIGQRWPDAFDVQASRSIERLGGPVMEVLCCTGVVRGKWNDLSRALDGHDEDAWAAGREARLAAMERMGGKALPVPDGAAMRRSARAA